MIMYLNLYIESSIMAWILYADRFYILKQAPQCFKLKVTVKNIYLAKPVFPNSGYYMNFLQNKNIDFYSLILLYSSNTESDGHWMGRIIIWIPL